MSTETAVITALIERVRDLERQLDAARAQLATSPPGEAAPSDRCADCWELSRRRLACLLLDDKWQRTP